MVLIRESESVSKRQGTLTLIFFKPFEPFCMCHFKLRVPVPSYVLFCAGMDEEEGDMPDVGDLAHEDDEDKHVRFLPGVADPHHFNAEPDPDLVFHFNTDPDPHFHLNADPDPFFI